MGKQSKNNKKISTGISLPKHMMEYLHSRAELEGVSTSELIRYLVRNMWDKELEEARLLEGDIRAKKLEELSGHFVKSKLCGN